MAAADSKSSVGPVHPLNTPDVSSGEKAPQNEAKPQSELESDLIPLPPLD
jgi:hypothetical protein